MGRGSKRTIACMYICATQYRQTGGRYVYIHAPMKAGGIAHMYLHIVCEVRLVSRFGDNERTLPLVLLGEKWISAKISDRRSKFLEQTIAREGRS